MSDAVKKAQSICRTWDKTPVLFNDDIEENCEFENTPIEGWATIIIDKDFIDEINSITDHLEVKKWLILFITY